MSENEQEQEYQRSQRKQGGNSFLKTVKTIFITLVLIAVAAAVAGWAKGFIHIPGVKSPSASSAPAKKPKPKIQGVFVLGLDSGGRDTLTISGKNVRIEQHACSGVDPRDTAIGAIGPKARVVDWYQGGTYTDHPKSQVVIEKPGQIVKVGGRVFFLVTSEQGKALVQQSNQHCNAISSANQTTQPSSSASPSANPSASPSSDSSNNNNGGSNSGGSSVKSKLKNELKKHL